MMSKTNKTSNALEILNRRFGNDADTQARLEEERVKSLAAMAIYDARIAAGLTQQQLAELVGTKQPVIARLEDADYEGHTVGMLNRVASALNQRLELRFTPLQTGGNPSYDSQRQTNDILASLVTEVHNLRTEVCRLSDKHHSTQEQETAGTASTG